MDTDQIRSARRLRAVRGSGLLDSPREGPFDRLAELARDLLQVPVAMVTVVDDERSFWKARVGIEADGQPIEESFCQYVVQDGRALVLDDARRDPRTMNNPSVKNHGVVAWAGFPIHAPDGEVLGTFCVVDTKPRQWTLTDVRVLKTLALAATSEVAMRVKVSDSEQGLRGAEQDRDAMQRLAIDAVAAARASHQMSLALQHSLLAYPDVDPDLTIATRYLAARDDNTVGGDWYDAFPRPDGTTTLVVGDVSGHDVAAMAAMGQVRSFVRALGYGAIAPAEVLRQVDQVMAGMQVPAVVTAVLAQLGPPRGEGRLRSLRWSNAGHPPPMLQWPDGRVEVLRRPHDLLLGVSGAAERSDHELQLPPGTRLLLYSDGLVERADEPMEAGVRWLAETLATVGSKSPDELVDLVVDGVARRAGDDVAVLLLHTH